jgi:hypothetical protein
LKKVSWWTELNTLLSNYNREAATALINLFLNSTKVALTWQSTKPRKPHRFSNQFRKLNSSVAMPGGCLAYGPPTGFSWPS